MAEEKKNGGKKKMIGTALLGAMILGALGLTNPLQLVAFAGDVKDAVKAYPTMQQLLIQNTGEHRAYEQSLEFLRLMISTDDGKIDQVLKDQVTLLLNRVGEQGMEMAVLRLGNAELKTKLAVCESKGEQP